MVPSIAAGRRCRNVRRPQLLAEPIDRHQGRRSLRSTLKPSRTRLYLTSVFVSAHLSSRGGTNGEAWVNRDYRSPGPDAVDRNAEEVASVGEYLTGPPADIAALPECYEGRAVVPQFTNHDRARRNSTIEA